MRHTHYAKEPINSLIEDHKFLRLDYSELNNDGMIVFKPFNTF